MSYKLTKQTLKKILQVGVDKFIEECKGEEDKSEEYILPYNKIVVQTTSKGTLVSFKYNECEIATLNNLGVLFYKGDELIIDGLEGKIKFTVDI